jgi:Arc/MetJ family transcription regulator
MVTNRRKTTIEIDQAKIKRVMKFTGVKTYREAVDLALTQAEKLGRMQTLFDGELFTSDKGDIIDPAYDVEALRRKER